MNRRDLLSSAPLVAILGLAPGAGLMAAETCAAPVDPCPGPTIPEVMAVITDLEGYSGYEMAAVVAAKLYAAYLIRRAIGLDVPTETLRGANDAVGYRMQAWQAYQRSYWAEKDLAEGKIINRPPVRLMEGGAA